MISTTNTIILSVTRSGATFAVITQRPRGLLRGTSEEPRLFFPAVLFITLWTGPAILRVQETLFATFATITLFRSIAWIFIFLLYLWTMRTATVELLFTAPARLTLVLSTF